MATDQAVGDRLDSEFSRTFLILLLSSKSKERNNDEKKLYIKKSQKLYDKNDHLFIYLFIV